MLPSPMRRNTVASAMFDKGPRERASSEGNTNSMASIRVNMMEQGRSRFAERHSLLAAGGVIHVRASQSISAHVALRTSFVRQAVRIVKASALEAISVRSLSRLSHCGVMGNATHFGRRRQQMVEMTSPGRRIFTLAIFVDCRPGKHALNTLGRPG